VWCGVVFLFSDTIFVLFLPHSSYSLYSPFCLHSSFSLYSFISPPYVVLHTSSPLLSRAGAFTSENQEVEDADQNTEENAEIEVEGEFEKEVVMSDLDMMLLSVGEELKSTTKPVKITEINEREKNKKINLSAIPGGLWTSGTGRRRRCGHTVDKNKNGTGCGVECVGDDRGDMEYSGEGQGNGQGNSSSKENGGNENSKMDVERNEMREEVLKKMKNGLLDPSKALPSDAISIAKNIFNDIDSYDEKVSNVLRLKRFLQLILNAERSRCEKGEETLFESVKLNSDNTKLNFRSKDKIPFDAYCFFVWGNNDNNERNKDENENKKENENANHNAVISCSNPTFKEIVIQAIKSII
jgi:hypothetical protein